MSEPILTLEVTVQDHATILAALRFYQGKGQGDPAARCGWIHDIATNNGWVVSLDDAGIDQLVGKIEIGPNGPTPKHDTPRGISPATAYMSADETKRFYKAIDVDPELLAIEDKIYLDKVMELVGLDPVAADFAAWGPPNSDTRKVLDWLNGHRSLEELLRFYTPEPLKRIDGVITMGNPYLYKTEGYSTKWTDEELEKIKLRRETEAYINAHPEGCPHGMPWRYLAQCEECFKD